MTTPKALKERQEKILKMLRVEGLILAFVLVVVGASEIWEERENDAQDRCVEQQITALTDSLNARGNITEREANATATVITEVKDAKSDADVQLAFEKYEETRKGIKADRAKNPFPPFPEGKCDNAD